MIRLVAVSLLALLAVAAGVAASPAHAQQSDSEERFTRTFQMAPVAMAIGARDGHLLCEINASFTQLTGYAAPAIIGKSLDEVRALVRRTTAATSATTAAAARHVRPCATAAAATTAATPTARLSSG